jgi:hypothetical protein
MVDLRDNPIVAKIYYKDSTKAEVIAYDTEPQTDFVEDGAFNPLDCIPILEQPSWVKIYRFINVANYGLEEAPIDHNYNSGLITTLYPKREFLHGELQRVCWFADKGFTDLVIEVNINYTRDSLGFPIERTTTRTWYKEDGSAASPTKVTHKEYFNDPILQLKEGVIRRGNLITNLTATVMGLMIATIPALEGENELERQARIVLMGRNFLALYKKEFNNFIDDSNKEVITAVTYAQDFWLDNPNPLAPGTTIRDYIVGELSAI